MAKPTLKTWAEDTPANCTEPTTIEADGYGYEDYVAGDHLNWLLQDKYRWIKWFSMAFTDFYLVGSDAFNDYATINLAVAANKSKIILTSDLLVTAPQEFSLSNGIIIGNGFKIYTTSTSFPSGGLLEIDGHENSVRDIILEGQHTSNSVDYGFLVGGNLNTCLGIKVFQNGSGGTMTTGFLLSGNYNSVSGQVQAKAGTITTKSSDTGTSNAYTIIEV
jgi:hypothetical protein